MKKNAGLLVYNIPFDEAEQGYIKDIKDKWTIRIDLENYIFWIQNEQVRIQFILRYGNLQ